MSNFTAIDFETANDNRASICQIGIIKFVNGEVVESWESLVNPEDFFGGMQIAIHGISPKMVKDSPTFPEVFDKVKSFLEDQIGVCHTAFDRVAFKCVQDKYSLPEFEMTWLDSARVARRTWEEVSQRGYGLKNLANMFEIEFDHHNAREDARACGLVLLKALEESKVSIPDWIETLSKKKSYSKSIDEAIRFKDGNPDGPLYGETILFTGTLEIPRHRAAYLASERGCCVKKGFSKLITILVVGDIDIRQTKGSKRTGKLRKAEELFESGHDIKIIGESDFMKLMDSF